MKKSWVLIDNFISYVPTNFYDNYQYFVYYVKKQTVIDWLIYGHIKYNIL
jgi:hypothetical protein